MKEYELTARLLRPLTVQMLAERVHPFMRDGDPHEWGAAISWAVETLQAVAKESSDSAYAQPIAAHYCFVVPFVPEGETSGGVWIPGHHKGISSIFGRVTAVAPSCRYVRPGDWCVFLPKRPHRLRFRKADLFAISELDLLAVIDPGDGSPWFQDATRRPSLRRFFLPNAWREGGKWVRPEL